MRPVTVGKELGRPQMQERTVRRAMFKGRKAPTTTYETLVAMQASLALQYALLSKHDKPLILPSRQFFQHCTVGQYETMNHITFADTIPKIYNACLCTPLYAVSL